MLSRFAKRRTIWCPTWLGWLAILVVMGAAIAFWSGFGESFLGKTDRRPAQALVLEGWIGVEGIHAAKAEFQKGGYQYIVTAGALMTSRWSTQRWNYATEAAEILVRSGIRADQVVVAPAPDTASRRTFESALAVRDALATRGLHPPSINVFTMGVHARRSRLVFAKALASGTSVGVISWTPSDYHAEERWWESSERSLDFFKESIAYVFEALLNSGRVSNSPLPK